MSINGNKSIINYFKPDKIDPDGTLYYNPFKLVPVINLLKESSTKTGGTKKSLYYAWESWKTNPSNVIGFKMLASADDEYLPVGDLIVNGPRGNEPKNTDKPYADNDLKEIILYYGVVGSYALYVKNDPKYSKKIRSSDFPSQASDYNNNGGGKNIIWTPTIKGDGSSDYVVMGNIFGELDNFSNPGTMNSGDRHIAAVHKYYLDKVRSDITHQNANDKGFGTGDWNVKNSGYVSYSSYFSNTWLVSHGGSVQFRDILPEMIQAICCSGQNALSQNELCGRVKSDANFCSTFMTNDYCVGSKLTDPECIQWCKSNNNYCDSNLKEHCKNVDIEYDSKSVAPSISWDKFSQRDIPGDRIQLPPSARSTQNSLDDVVTFYEHGNYSGKSFTAKIGQHRWMLDDFNDMISSIKIPNGIVVKVYKDYYFTGEEKIFTESQPDLTGFHDVISSFKIDKLDVTDPSLKISLDKCKQMCNENSACKAIVYNDRYGTCSLNKENESQGNFESNMYYSHSNSDVYIKRNNTEDKLKNMKTCACFKPQQYYIDYFNSISSKYPKDIKDMIDAAASTKDRVCFYSDCISGDSIKYRELKDKGSSPICGNTNLQVCFQNVDASGSALKNSTITNQQKIQCQQKVTEGTGGGGGDIINAPPQSGGGGGGSNNNNDNIFKPPPNLPIPGKAEPEESFFDKYKWWIISGIVVFFIIIIIAVVMLI